MLVTLCQLLVVLFSLFRAVWDFLVGCLGFFTEGSCSLFYPLIAWVCATRCIFVHLSEVQGKAWVITRFSQRRELVGREAEGREGTGGGNSMWVSYHVVSLLDSLAKVRACLLCSLRTLPPSVFVNNNCGDKNLTRATGEKNREADKGTRTSHPLQFCPSTWSSPWFSRTPACLLIPEAPFTFLPSSNSPRR